MDEGELCPYTSCVLYKLSKIAFHLTTERNIIKGALCSFGESEEKCLH